MASCSAELIGGRRRSTRKAGGRRKAAGKRGGSKAARKTGGRRHRHTKRCKHRRKGKKSHRGGSTKAGRTVARLAGDLSTSGRIMAGTDGQPGIGGYVNLNHPEQGVFTSAAVNFGRDVGSTVRTGWDRFKGIF